MANTRGKSSKVATGIGSDPPKKKGKQPVTASRRKRTAASTTSSVDDAAKVSGLASLASATATTTMAVAKLSTVIAAASSTVTADGILDINANKDDADNFIPSPPRRGKKQKQDALPTPPNSNTKASKSPPKNKQPKPRVCWWYHCPFPYIGQMLVHCSEDGCTRTMHHQCVEEFEKDIGYNDSKDKIPDTFYCHTHHPKREFMEDLIGRSISPVYSDENDGEKKDTQSAVNQNLPLPLPPLLPPLSPPQPHQKHANHCDWWMSDTCCIAPELPLQKCQMEDCNRMVHHLCQNTWHESKQYEPHSIARYCRLHDKLYHIMFPAQAALDVTVDDPISLNAKSDIFYGSSSEAEDPPLCAAGNQCDWAHSEIGCVAHFCPTETCQKESCNVQCHHQCQHEYHAYLKLEVEPIPTYCRYHDPTYSSRHQMAVPAFLLPDNLGTSDEEEKNEDRHGDTAAGDAAKEDAAKEDGGLKDAEKEEETTEEDDGVDDNNSGDDCSEAEIHDAAVEFGGDMDNTIDDLYGVDFIPPLPGAPDGWKPPGPPDGWEYNPGKGVPTEDEIDNPGKWNLYSFAPKIDRSTKMYKGHFTPANAMVVPKDENGERKVGNWKFYYTGWQPDEFDNKTFVRGEARYKNLKPESRKGCLDVNILRKHGLMKDRMTNDALFFYQLLFPIVDPKNSGVDGDVRMPYFTTAAVYTNVYAATSGAGAGMGHSWETVSAPELVRWTACPIRNGAMDGRPSTLPSRWMKGDARFDPFIYDAMSYTRWKLIKRFFKMNNNLTDVKKKGDDGYDPCRKYDLIYKVLVHNMNYVSKRADLDVTVDESTWGFGGYSGDCGQRLLNKPVSRGE